MARKRILKYWIGQIHLWLGLASGLVVLIVSITGCLFVFQKEISELLYKDKYFIEPSSSGKTLPLSILQQKAQTVLGAGRPIGNITTYHMSDRAWEFMAYQSNDTALTYFGAVGYFQSVFINPYTGAVTGTTDYKYDFFSIVKYLHWSLLLNTDYGQPIVGWSTLIFVLLLITGIILWWPKKWNKAYKNRSFKIKWKAAFKRVNYDLHNVPGFYSLFPALIIALTGMVFAFRWFSGFVYVVASGTTTAPSQAVVKSIRPATDSLLLDGTHALGRIAASDRVAPMDGTARTDGTAPTDRIAATGGTAAMDGIASTDGIARTDGTALTDRIAARGRIAATGGIATRDERGPVDNPLDKAFLLAQQQLPRAARFGLSMATGPEGTIDVYGYKDGETYYGSDALQFDQYTGELLHRRNNSEKNRGERLVEMNYDIHVGAIGGLTGKIIAFIASLVCASLPVTGFLIWWGKRRRSPRVLSNAAIGSSAGLVSGSIILKE